MGGTCGAEPDGDLVPDGGVVVDGDLAGEDNLGAM